MRGVGVGVVVLAAVLGRVGGQTSLEIAWDRLSASQSSPTSGGVPVGCSCVDTSESPCTKFSCTCVCDLTAGACDAGCCCDGDCSSDEKAAFAGSEEGCAPSGAAEAHLERCVDLENAAELAEVNAKHRMVVLQRQSGAQSLLCIAVDNNPVVGTFLDDVDTLPSAVFSRDDISSLPSYSSSSSSASSSTSDRYSAGDVVLGAFSTDGGSLVGPKNGVLAFPGNSGQSEASAGVGGGRWQRTDGASEGASGGSFAGSIGGGDGGVCEEDGLVVRYGESVGSRGVGEAESEGLYVRPGAMAQLGPTCRTREPVSSRWCGQRAMERFVDRLWVGKSPQASLSDTSTFVQASLGQLRRVATNGSVQVLHGGARSAAETTFNENDCSCWDAVVAARIRIGSNALDRIVRVRVDLDIVDVITPQTCNTTISTPLSISVAFGRDNVTAAALSSSSSLASNDIIHRPRSGNPGYVTGMPVLAGSIVEATLASSGDTVQAVAAFTNGLQLPSPSLSGTCPASLPTVSTSTSIPFLPVTFGDDIAATCTDTLPRRAADFSAECNARSGIKPAFLTLNATRIGVFGNADPLDVEQWLTLTTPGVDGFATTYDATRRECQGLIGEAHLQILAARVGEVGNPQRKIVAAKLTFHEVTVQLPAEDIVAPPDAGETVPFELRFVVSFAELDDAELTPFIPPPPSAVKLPFDIWYPFELDQRDYPQAVDASLVDTHAAPVRSSFSTATAVLLAIAVGTIAWGCATPR